MVAQQVVSALDDLLKVVGFDVRLIVVLIKLKLAVTGLFFGALPYETRRSLPETLLLQWVLHFGRTQRTLSPRTAAAGALPSHTVCEGAQDFLVMGKIPMV